MYSVADNRNDKTTKTQQATNNLWQEREEEEKEKMAG